MQLKRTKRRGPVLWLAAGIFAWLQAGDGFAQQGVAEGEGGQQDAPAQQQTAPQQTEQQQTAPQQPPQPASRFDLLELRVKGNTLLERKRLERTVYPFLGLGKSIDDVDKARAALEEQYRAQGFQTVAVDIPEQDVKNGVVYLHVVEGKVSRLRVKDSRYFSLGKIKAAVPELAEGNVPNMPLMQKQLTALAAETPDRQIMPVLRAGNTPGAMEVDLKVKDELPLHGRVELNARNTNNTGTPTTLLRLVNSLRYDNLWQRQHSASLMYQVSPMDSSQVSVWVGSYAMPLAEDGTRLSVYAVSSSSSAPSIGSILGGGEIYGVRLLRPFNAAGNYLHSATLGADYKHFTSSQVFNGETNPFSPISYLPFLAQYSGTLRGKESYASLDLGLHVSVSGLGNSAGEFNTKICGQLLANTCQSGNPGFSAADYLYLTSDFRLQHDLPLGMEMVAHTNAQVADRALITYEQYSLGGMQSVRGYYENMAFFDNGVFGSLELRSPHLTPDDWESVNRLKLLAFVEAGKGWWNNPNNPITTDVLSSAGGGFNFQLWKSLSGSFAVGVPFNSFVHLGAGGGGSQVYVQSGAPRIHFSVATDF